MPGWPDSFVEEANLSHHVFTLRKALGEDKNDGGYIETIPRRGYRFVPKVSEVRDESVDILVAEHSRSHIVVQQTEEIVTANSVGVTAHAITEGRRIEPALKRVGLIALAASAVIAIAVASYFLLANKTRREGSGLGLSPQTCSSSSSLDTSQCYV